MKHIAVEVQGNTLSVGVSRTVTDAQRSSSNSRVLNENLAAARLLLTFTDTAIGHQVVVFLKHFWGNWCNQQRGKWSTIFGVWQTFGSVWAFVCAQDGFLLVDLRRVVRVRADVNFSTHPFALSPWAITSLEEVNVLVHRITVYAGSLDETKDGCTLIIDRNTPSIGIIAFSAAQWNIRHGDHNIHNIGTWNLHILLGVSTWTVEAIATIESLDEFLVRVNSKHRVSVLVDLDTSISSSDWAFSSAVWVLAT